MTDLEKRALDDLDEIAREANWALKCFERDDADGLHDALTP